jgi:hypothetical protein
MALLLNDECTFIWKKVVTHRAQENHRNNARTARKSEQLGFVAS